MDKMKSLAKWVLIIVVISAIGWIVFERQGKLHDIRDNGILVKAEIVEILRPSKGTGSFNFRCSFNYEGEQKLLISPTSVTENGSKYVGKACPTVYSPQGNNLRVLLRPEDFNEYSIPLTDSLIQVINTLNQ